MNRLNNWWLWLFGVPLWDNDPDPVQRGGWLVCGTCHAPIPAGSRCTDCGA